MPDRRRLALVVTPLLALLAGVLATAYAAGASGRDPDDAPPPPWFETHPTVIVELRVWQNVDHEERVWVSARPEGGRWATLGTVQLAWHTWRNWSSGYGEMARHRFDDIAVGGVTLRVWQRWHDPQSIYVQVCGHCPPEERSSVLWLPWHPLGKIPLPLDDGRTASGRYRYGDLDIAAPSNNPGLLADREHLLALRDVLEGEGTAELDWDAGTPTAEWEGIALGGAPPRVTELNLPIRGLTGEIWGWLGDLSELTRLDLVGNRLTGSIPSKLHLLRNLTHVGLGSNLFDGCIPPGLWRATHHDLEYLELPRCGTPERVGSATTPTAAGRIFRVLLFSYSSRTEPYIYVFDVPAWRSVRERTHTPTSTNHNPASILTASFVGIHLEIGSGDETWVFLDDHTLDEMERSHYSGCIYDCGRWKSPAARIEQLVASIWVNRAVTDINEWVWP